MFRILGAAAVLGFLFLAFPIDAWAEDDKDAKKIAFVDRDGDGICDKFQNKGSESKNRHRHRIRHRNRGKSTARSFGYGHGKS